MCGVCARTHAHIHVAHIPIKQRGCVRIFPLGSIKYIRAILTSDRVVPQLIFLHLRSSEKIAIDRFSIYRTILND